MRVTCVSVVSKNAILNKNFFFSSLQTMDSWDILGWKWHYGRQNVTLVHNKEIKVRYPRTSRNPKNKPVGGFGAVFECEPERELEFSYDVSFAPDFEWVKGGKLHGIYFKDHVSGGEKAKEGGSIRFMWRKGGQAEVYVYHPKQKAKYGDSFKFKGKFVKGQRNALSIKWSKRGEFDLIEAKLNGETLEIPFQFNHLPSGVFYSTFFGGNDRSWRARKDETVVFNDFELKVDGKKVDCFFIEN